MNTQEIEKEYETVYKLIIRSCIATSPYSRTLKNCIYDYLNRLEALYEEKGKE